MYKLFLFFLLFGFAGYSQNGCIDTFITCKPFDIKFPTSVNQNTNGLTWNNRNSILTDNNQNTTASLTGVLATLQTRTLTVNNFGFNIPSYKNVCGVEILIKKRSTGGINVGGFVVDNQVMFTGGNNLANNNVWDGNYETIYYGGVGFVNGNSPNTINNNNFSVNISATISTGVVGAPVRANIDYVAVRVYVDDTTFKTCPLSKELISFENKIDNGELYLKWDVDMNQNDYLFFELSNDYIDWSVFNITNDKKGSYLYKLNNNGIFYLRLYLNEEKLYETSFINDINNQYVIYDLLGNKVDGNYKGVVIIKDINGKITKKFLQ